MNDEQIEQEIQVKGLTAPRVTPADIEANIVSEYYFTAADGVDGTDIARLRGERADLPLFLPPLVLPPLVEDPLVEDPDMGKTTEIGPLRLLTFCVLVLRNGFTVTGESACVSPENFDADLGRKIARQNAVSKIWPLMGYALKERVTDHSAESTL